MLEAAKGSIIGTAAAGTATFRAAGAEAGGKYTQGRGAAKQAQPQWAAVVSVELKELPKVQLD